MPADEETTRPSEKPESPKKKRSESKDARKGDEVIRWDDLLEPTFTPLPKHDSAAKAAEEELQKHLDDWTARDVAAWWCKWQPKTGDECLGRIMMALSPHMPPPG